MDSALFHREILVAGVLIKVRVYLSLAHDIAQQLLWKYGPVPMVLCFMQLDQILERTWDLAHAATASLAPFPGLIHPALHNVHTTTGLIPCQPVRHPRH